MNKNPHKSIRQKKVSVPYLIGNTAKATIKGVIAFLLVTMSLFHIFLPNENYKIKNLTIEYRKALNQRDSVILIQFEKLANGTSSEHDAKMWYLENKTFIKSFGKRKTALAKESSFLGRSSLRFWLTYFGITILALFFSIKSLKDDIIKKSKFKTQFLSLTGITVSSFWTYFFIFKTQADFNTNTYLFTTILCALICTIFIYHFTKYYTYKDNIIRTLLDFIKRMKNKHYIDVAVKAKYAEQYNKALSDTKTVKQHADELDKDIDKTFNQLL